MFGKDGRRRLSRTRENSCGYSNVTRRISRAVLTQQTTIDSFSYICVCVCVRERNREKESEKERTCGTTKGARVIPIVSLVP